VTGPLRRGDVVTVAAGGGFGSKPRPALVIQDDRYADLSTVVLVLFTTELTDTRLRARYVPTPGNGLDQISDLMVDILVTARREKIGSRVGRLSPAEMALAERALLVFLGFA